MSRPEILRVWGRADNIDLNFEKVGTEWLCSVPADTEDGAYACELNALNAHGNYGFWTGFLYMCSGICHFELYPVDFRLFFDDCESNKIHFSDLSPYPIDSTMFYNNFENFEIEFSDLEPRIIFDRRCPHI